MFNKTITLLLAISFTACSSERNATRSAMEKAKQGNLTEFSSPQRGVPFYRIKTLDPVWMVSDDIVQMPRLRLKDERGGAISPSFFSDKLSLVFFFFTSCSGFCPTLVSNLKRVEKRLEDFPEVRLVGITVDPKRDTPSILKSYKRHLKLDSPRWTFLSGEENEIYRLAHETFAAEAFALPKSKGQFAHSEHVFVIDGNGRLRGMVRGTRLDAPEEAFRLISEIRATHPPT